MTIRDMLNKKKRDAAIIYFVAFATLAISILMMISINYKPIILFVVIASIICFLSLLHLFFGIRCPKCSNNLGSMTAYSFSSPFSIPKKINYCPYCGIKMDEKV